MDLSLPPSLLACLLSKRTVCLGSIHGHPAAAAEVVLVQTIAIARRRRRDGAMKSVSRWLLDMTYDNNRRIFNNNNNNNTLYIVASNSRRRSSEGEISANNNKYLSLSLSWRHPSSSHGLLVWKCILSFYFFTAKILLSAQLYSCWCCGCILW